MSWAAKECLLFWVAKKAWRQNSVCCMRQKSVLLWAAKECLSFWVVKDSFSFWAAKEGLLLWEAEEFLQQAEKEFSSYAAKIREGKDRESTELQPVSSGKLRFQGQFSLALFAFRITVRCLLK